MKSATFFSRILLLLVLGCPMLTWGQLNTVPITADTLYTQAFETATFPAAWWTVSTHGEINWLIGDQEQNQSVQLGTDHQLHIKKSADIEGEQLAVLTSGEIVIPEARANCILSLDVNCQLSGQESRFSIEIGKGGNWRTIYQQQAAYWGSVMLDTGPIRTSTFQLKFVFEGNSNLDEFIGIDNIILLGPNNTCDNGICELGENPESCPGDCPLMEAPGKFWVELGEDLSGKPVQYRTFKGRTACDDCSEGINLPFEFPFYEDTYNQIYLNANGNLTFEDYLYEFTPSPFCLSGPKMIAPFFADVDIERCGQIDYFVNDHYLVVTWSDVCHYRGQDAPTGLNNSFQAIITDGTIEAIKGQPIPSGLNVIFNYGDMQWTTGHASGGIEGLAGAAATIGINRGDGLDCYAYGSFNHPGHDYRPPASGENTYNGVDHLDYRSITFDTGASLVETNDPVAGIDMHIFPNPFSDRLMLEFVLQEESETQYRVTHMSGKVIREETQTYLPGLQQISVDLTTFPAGIYIVSVQVADRVYYRQVAKR